MAKSHKQCVNQQRGFTLLELLVSTTIFSVLAMIAVPSFESMMTNNSMTTETNELVAALHLARSEAITRGQNVTICVANPGLTACSGVGNWSDGWVVLDNLANVIRVHETLRTDHLMTELAIVGGAGTIIFNRNGFTGNARTIRLCGPKKKVERARGVIVSVDGRVRLATDTNSNDISEDRSGTDFACP